ncbi:hypothetical protein ACWKSP_00640 [Micromonosporaceae bacterium Da 78-11]
MDTPELAALVPDLMARHPTHGWTLRSGLAQGDDLVVEVQPMAWPERVAVVRVNAGAEVFGLAFAGHEAHDFAYEDADRSTTLRERLDLAVRATGGPTRVIRERAAGLTVRTTLVIDPEGPDLSQDVVSYPVRRLKAFLRAGRITRESADFPARPVV